MNFTGNSYIVQFWLPWIDRGTVYLCHGPLNTWSWTPLAHTDRIISQSCRRYLNLPSTILWFYQVIQQSCIWPWSWGLIRQQKQSSNCLGPYAAVRRRKVLNSQSNRWKALSARGAIPAEMYVSRLFETWIDAAIRGFHRICCFFPSSR